MTYNIELNKMIPLKAFFCGVKIKDNSKTHSDKIINDVNKCIEKCGTKKGIKFSRRKIFYLLLKCELSRETDKSLEDRKIAKDFCEVVNCEVFFDNYMTIVNGSIMEKKVIGGGSFSQISKNKISSHKTRDGFDSYGKDVHKKEESVLKSLNLIEKRLSYKDIKFLYETSYSQIKQKHGLINI